MSDLATTELGVTPCGNMEFHWGKRTHIMGIINVTPDSFSGDGLGGNVEAALAQARRFVQDGADILDVGGESTRPGSSPVSVEEEMRRVIPVVEVLAVELDVPISVDTYKTEVAREALEAGADMINDVWGLKHDPRLAALAAEKGVPIVLMHNQVSTEYKDLVPDVIESLRQSIEVALNAGVPPENIIIDPGIGFGKTRDHNLQIMNQLCRFRSLRRPILLGTSRKSTIGYVLDLPPDERVEGTAATVAIAIANGADIVRVHDVLQMTRVARMSDAIVRWKPA